ncbi:PAAR domain-containing protein [Vibrio metschnikovii]|uniref:PAAR domain-containing protein n=1 Tax=Vibrio metschnikovii TaxID=28172 RepID=UPI001C2FC94C|nr:PAAR domain-containing protein [Vibrio metschnikovii]
MFSIGIGSKTSTGGEVIEGNNGLMMNGLVASSVGHQATCKSGRKECRGVGPIVAVGPRSVNLPAGSAARVGDYVDCGCPKGSNVLIGSGSVQVGSSSASSNVDAMSRSSAAMNTAASSMSSASNTSSASSTVPKINPNNMYWPPYNPLAPEGEKYIEVEYINPITSIAVLSLEEAQEFYKNLGGKETLGNIRDYSDLTKGGAEAYATAKGLGGLGVKASTKTINGKDWVIIRDFRRHQQTLMKGNKWGANNPKVVQAGLGLNDVRGAARYVRFNAGIEIAFAVGINAADYILRDEATLAEFVGNSAGDLAKGFVSLAGAAFVTSALLPATATVLFTGLVFAVVSFGFGKILDSIDNEYGYSQDISEAVEHYFQ